MPDARWEEKRAKKDKKRLTEKERADRLIAHHWSSESASECGVWIPSSFESRSVSLTSRVRTGEEQQFKQIEGDARSLSCDC